MASRPCASRSWSSTGSAMRIQLSPLRISGASSRGRNCPTARSTDSSSSDCTCVVARDSPRPRLPRAARRARRPTVPCRPRGPRSRAAATPRAPTSFATQHLERHRLRALLARRVCARAQQRLGHALPPRARAHVARAGRATRPVRGSLEPRDADGALRRPRRGRPRPSRCSSRTSAHSCSHVSGTKPSGSGTSASNSSQSSRISGLVGFGGAADLHGIQCASQQVVGGEVLERVEPRRRARPPRHRRGRRPPCAARGRRRATRAAARGGARGTTRPSTGRARAAP